MPTPEQNPAPADQPELPAAYGGAAVAAVRALGKLDTAINTAAMSVVEAVTGMLDQVLTEIRASRPLCVPCRMARARWNRVNAAALELANSQYARAAIAEATGEGHQPNLADFLPEEIRPHPADPTGADGHMPGVFPAVGQVGGTDVCHLHLAELEDEQAAQPDSPTTAKRPLILTGLSVHAAARLANSHQPGMPGAPGN